MTSTLGDEYISVAEAATQLKISQSTLWRWIDQGMLPAYRVGQRRVRLKKIDLTTLITPARQQEKGDRMAEKERERLQRPLTKEEQQHALATLACAEELQQRLLERRGGHPFPSSWKDLDKARAERNRQLQ